MKDSIKHLKTALFHIKHAFIPHQHNNHWPHLLRTHMLLGYGSLLVVVKILATALLFITFPNPAELSKENIQKIFELTNQSRIEVGLEPLRLDPYLSFVAEIKADDMADKMYFSHYTPEGYAPWYFIDESKYDYSFAGENLAMNFSEMNSVQRAFMASPGHRENILHPEFKDIGLAIRLAEIDGKQTQILVEYFGTTKNNSGERLAQKENSIESESTPIEGEINTGENFDEKTVVADERIEIEENFNFSEELLVFANTVQDENTALKIYRWSHHLFLLFLAFIVISLFINIIVKIRVQHAKLLIQSSLLVLLIAGLVFTRIHFLEGLNLTLQIY